MRGIVLIALLLLSSPLHAVVLDRIAATVDREVITLSELNQIIETRLIARNAGESEDAYRRRALDSLIAQALRYRDVLRFGAEDVAPETITARMTEISARFASPAEFDETLRRAELSLEDLTALVKRQLQVEAYIEERFSPLIFVSLDEIESYYEETFLPARASKGLPPQPLATVREEIRTILKAERLGSEISKWTAQLRSRANVDIFVYR